MTELAVYSTDGPKVYPEQGTEEHIDELIDQLSSVPPWANVYYDGENDILLHRFEAFNEDIIDRLDNYYVKIRLGSEDVTSEGIPELARQAETLWHDGWESPTDDGEATHPKRFEDLRTLPERDTLNDTVVEDALKETSYLKWTVPDIVGGYQLLRQLIAEGLSVRVVIAKDVDRFDELGDVLIELGGSEKITPSDQTDTVLNDRRAELQENAIGQQYEAVEDAVLSFRHSIHASPAAFDQFRGSLVILEWITNYIDPQSDTTQQEADDRILHQDVVQTVLTAEDHAEQYDTVDADDFRRRIASLVSTQQRQVITEYFDNLDTDYEHPEETLEQLSVLEAEFIGEPDSSGLLPDIGESTTSWAAIEDRLQELQSEFGQGVAEQEADELDEQIKSRVKRLAERDDIPPSTAERELLARAERITFPRLIRAYASLHTGKTILAIILLLLIIALIGAGGAFAASLLPI